MGELIGRTGNDSVIENLGVEDAEIVIYNADYYYQFETDENGVITENGKNPYERNIPAEWWVTQTVSLLTVT